MKNILNNCTDQIDLEAHDDHESSLCVVKPHMIDSKSH